MDFVKAEDIDDRYFETPYYLTPQKGAHHAYALLRDALQASGRVGIAKVIIRDAQHLAAVEVIDNALVLTMLRYADELVDTSQLEFPARENVRKAELDMAKIAHRQSGGRMGSVEVHRRIPRESDEADQGPPQGREAEAARG